MDDSLDKLLNWANVKYGDLVKLEDAKPEELAKLLKVNYCDVDAAIYSYLAQDSNKYLSKLNIHSQTT